MIILISGAVGTGKSTIAKKISEKLDFKLINLNEIAKKFKLKEIKELQTFDFDLDSLLKYIENEIINLKKSNKNIILESHFAHFINPKLVDFLFIINRNLPNLKKEYKKRNYNKQKEKDNLEVEAFNLCFYEGIDEGYEEEKQIYCIENNTNVEEIIEIIEKKIN